MSARKDPLIISLRAMRKASHIGGKITSKTSALLQRTENKTSRIIINKTGSINGDSSVAVSQLLHERFPFMTPLHPALPRVGQRPSITVFAFLDPKGFYGGIATLLLTAAELAKTLDMDLRVAQTTGYSNKTDVLGFLSSNGIDIPASRYSTIDVSFRTPEHFAYLPLHPGDIVIVSAWWDAHIASLLPLNKKFVYLIQDHEPIFYSNSDEKQFAESTYWSKKFIPICNTELLYDFFKKQGYSYIADNAVWFEPAVGKQPPAEPTSSPKKRLFLYGRPNVNRNLFYSALKAIDIVLTDAQATPDDWEIFCAGQNDIQAARFNSGVTMKNLGKMNIDKYYAFARTIDVAISPMLAPHPNYPTLEFSSLGAMVVSTKYETKQDLSRYSKNILLADPTIEDMARQIKTACAIAPQVRYDNLQNNNIGTDWHQNLAAPIKELTKRL